jgi:plasmid stabilization system protein ParE
VPKALELHFSPRAERDIDRIYDYTEDEWGAQQAEKYTTELRSACEKLTGFPKGGRSAGHVRAPDTSSSAAALTTSSSAKKGPASSSSASRISAWISSGIYDRRSS